MSEVVDLDLQAIESRGRRADYPWETWFDGRTHRIVKGEDYTLELKSFRSTLYSAADRLGVEVVTRVIDGDLHVQAVTPLGAAPRHTANGKGDSDAQEDEGRVARGGRRTRPRVQR